MLGKKFREEGMSDLMREFQSFVANPSVFMQSFVPGHKSNSSENRYPIVYPHRQVDDNTVLVEVDVPGYDPSRLEVLVQGKSLTIRYEKTEEEKKDDGKIVRTREFTHQISLPFEAEANGVKAEVKNGVMSVTVPRSPQSLPHKVNVVSE